MRIWQLALCLISIGSSMSTPAQVLTVTNSPRGFSVATPTSWLQQPVSTGSSRVKFSSPTGTPSAECSVLVKEFPGLSGLPQDYFDSIILKQTSAIERTEQLASRYNNVRVWGIGFSSISGFPGQSYNVSFSVGTPFGEMWYRAFYVESATAPGLVWTIGCGGSGKNLEEASRAFSFWQNEIMKFSTNIRIL